MKNESQHERLPRKFSLEIRPGPRSWHLPDFITFIWKYVLLNNSSAFKDFRKFVYGKVRLNSLIQFIQIKEKSIFSASEGGKEPSSKSLMLLLSSSPLVRDSCFVLVSRLPEKLKNIAPILRYSHNQGMTPETTDISALDYLVYQLSWCKLATVKSF